jgi:hypothetical protein
MSDNDPASFFPYPIEGFIYTKPPWLGDLPVYDDDDDDDNEAVEFGSDEDASGSKVDNDGDVNMDQGEDRFPKGYLTPISEEQSADDGVDGTIQKFVDIQIYDHDYDEEDVITRDGKLIGHLSMS